MIDLSAGAAAAISPAICLRLVVSEMGLACKGYIPGNIFVCDTVPRVISHPDAIVILREYRVALMPILLQIPRNFAQSLVVVDAFW